MKNVTCNNCGWVAVQVSRAHAELEVTKFNIFYDSLPEKQKQDYYGSKPASIALYEHCQLCGSNYRNYRDFKPGDCPEGCTLSPVIDRNE